MWLIWSKFEEWKLIQNCKMLQVTYSVKQLIVPASALLLAKQQRKKWLPLEGKEISDVTFNWQNGDASMTFIEQIPCY